MQSRRFPFVPASGAWTRFTLTVLLTLTHGGGTAMVYVYDPLTIVAGSN